MSRKRPYTSPLWAGSYNATHNTFYRNSTCKTKIFDIIGPKTFSADGALKVCSQFDGRKVLAETMTAWRRSIDYLFLFEFNNRDINILPIYHILIFIINITDSGETVTDCDVYNKLRLINYY